MWGRRLLFVLPALIFLGAAVALYLGLGPERQPGNIPSALLDRPAPQFSLPPVPGLDQPGLATADLAGQGVTLVNVWASWCLPCRAEHPFLVQLAQREGVRLVGIAYKDDPAKAAAFLRELGNPFAAVGDDREGRAGIEWGISGVPETFVLDGAGVIRWRHVGALDRMALENTILPLVRELSR